MEQNQTEQKTETKIEEKKQADKVTAKAPPKEKFKHVDEAVGVGSDVTPANAKPKGKERGEKTLDVRVKPFEAMLKEATTVDDVVKLYNDMVPTAVDFGFKKIGPVQMFVDLKTGKFACTKLHERIQKQVNQSEKKEAKMAKKSAKKTKKAARSSARGPRVSLTDDTKITWTGKANPYREGTGSWKRTEAVRTNSGQSVKTLRSKKVKSGTIRTLLRGGLVKAS